MTEAWKQSEGQAINGEFPLRQYLGGSEHSAVFLTEYGEQGLQKAAIKLIPAGAEKAELQLSRWKLAAKLSHPHLIRLFRTGYCQWRNRRLLYAVMEYAEENLSQVLPHRPLTPAEARDMLEPALDALAYIHDNGFVHGHMKPSNIMAVGDRLKVSSDGLCRLGDGSRAGKPGLYDPPESAEEGMSPAGDVWSLGMTLVEVLTQRLPVWDATEQQEPLLPETLPAPFLDIARHCLRRDPRCRWSLAEIAARLAPQHQHVTEPRPVVTRKDEPAKRRYVVPVVTVGLSLAAILAGSRLLHRGPAPPVVFEQSNVRPSDAVAPSTPPPAEEEPKTPTRDRAQGEVRRQVLPDVPRKVRDTIQGTVRVSVQVLVDPSGSVREATLDSPGPSKYFAYLALQAARRWQFAPAKMSGQVDSSLWILRFEFTNTATRAFSVEAAL